MSRRLRATAAVLLAGSLVLTGCSALSGGGDAPPTATPPTSRASGPLPGTAWTTAAASSVRRGGSLRLAVTAIPRSFNPLHPDGAMSDASEILAPTAGTATHLAADGSATVDPTYATSVTIVDKDPLTIAVKLNPRGVWQDGSPIVATDMVSAWKALNGSDKKFEVASTAGYKSIASVTPGSNRFNYEVRFTTPTSDWPLYIYPRLPRSVTSDAATFNSAFRSKAIPSNGPFVVSAINAKTGTVTETRNPRWWGRTPRLSTIRWRTATPTVQAKAYAAGELDAVDLGPDNYAVARTVGTVQRAAGLEWTQLTLNGARGPLKDVEVRRAVAHAIDRRSIAKRSATAVGAPPAVLGSYVYVPGQRGYHDSSAAIAYDPGQARALLKKAGYTAGPGGTLERDGSALRLTMPVPSDTPANSDRSRSIVADLKKVGIAVTLKSVPASTFFSRQIVSLDFDLVTFTWRGSPFPVTAAESLFYPVDSGQNFTGLGNRAIGSAWQKVTATLDRDKREAGVRGLDEQLFGVVPIVPLAVTPIVIAVRRTLVNYGASQFEQPDWTVVGFRSS